MQLEGLIHRLPRHSRMFVLAFLLSLSFGYFSGFKYLMNTTHLKVSGIEENYNGNENDEDAEEMKFKKSEVEIFSLIHTHALSMSLIFLALGGILLTTRVPVKLKQFLLIEPFISIIVTFGGIYLLWKDISWMKYIVMISGILLSLSFVVSVLAIIWDLVTHKETLSEPK